VPIYEFECRKCGHRFTRRISWSEKASTRCPECGGDQLKEIFGLNVVSTGGGAGGTGAACGGFG